MEKVLKEIKKIINIYDEMDRFKACREIMETIKEKDIQEKFSKQKENVINAIETELEQYKDEKDIEKNKTEFSLLVELCNKIEEATLEDDRNMKNEIFKLQYIYKNRQNKTLAEEIEYFVEDSEKGKMFFDDTIEILDMKTEKNENKVKENDKNKTEKHNNRLQIIYNAGKDLYLIQNNMKNYTIKCSECDKDAKKELTSDQIKEFKKKIEKFSSINGGDKNIAYILYKYDFENNTQNFQNYVNLIDSPLEEEKKWRLSNRIRANIIYDLRKLYDGKTTYTREERVQIFNIANKAKKNGVAQVRKSLKCIIMEPIDRLICNYNRHVILSLEKAKNETTDRYMMDVENLGEEEKEDNKIGNEEAIRKRLAIAYEKYQLEQEKQMRDQEEQKRLKEEQIKKYNESIERNRAYFKKQGQKNKQSKWENGNIVVEDKDEQEK